MLLNLNRPNVRGIKKCRSCGLFNGNRSKSCKNQNCPQFLECNNSKWRRQTKNIKYPLESPVDPIKLISHDKDVQYFSVKVADKLAAGNYLSRSFVRIEERTIETDRNTVVICRTAVCNEATCTKSVSSLANCRHIVECLNQCKKAATVMPIMRSKFLRFFSHLTEAERIELWDYYSTCQGAVQQLRNNLFVVKAMQCGDKENSGGLNVKAGIREFVHCELGHKLMDREPVFRCSCTNYQTRNTQILCHHILLLYSAIDGDSFAREQYKTHLDSACKKLDLHELDLFDLEMDLGLNWDLKASEIINDMITEEILQGESLELSDQEMEFIDDLLVEDFDEFFKETDESVDASQSNHGMNLSVSFDTILTSIIERMNCNFAVCSGESPRPEKETNVRQLDEFVFYVHNVSAGGGGGGMTLQVIKF